jgi:hypothetical protein
MSRPRRSEWRTLALARTGNLVEGSAFRLEPDARLIAVGELDAARLKGALDGCQIRRLAAPAESA